MSDGVQAETSPRGSTPVPDPTLLTTKQLESAVEAERDYVNGMVRVLEERLTGIDRATELRLTGIIDIPHQIDEKVNHLASLMAERFDGVRLQFTEREVRSEREARDNKVAVDAAFAAQKEAAAREQESNLKAIDKSEKATDETIKKLADLFNNSNKALADKYDDLKERIVAVEARLVTIEVNRVTVRETRGDVSAGQDRSVQLLGLIIAALAVAFVAYASFH